MTFPIFSPVWTGLDPELGSDLTQLPTTMTLPFTSTERLPARLIQIKASKVAVTRE